MAHFEKELERREVYRGRIFTLTSHRVGLENGGESRRDIVNHHGGACVAALDEEGRVLLVRQYRFGVKEELLELRKGHLAMLRTLSSPVGRKPSVWHWLTKGPRLV